MTYGYDSVTNLLNKGSITPHSSSFDIFYRLRMTEIFAEEADAMSERDSVDESYKIGQQTREGVLFSDSFSAVERHAYPDIDDGCVIS